MVTIKDLMQSKYAQNWYRPKIIQKIWLNLYFQPVLTWRLVKAEVETKWHILRNPDFRKFFWLMIQNGYGKEVIKHLKIEEKVRSSFS